MEWEAPCTAHLTNDTMGGSFNKLGNCLTFATLTGYGKAEIHHVNEEDVKCRLVEQMFDLWEGIMYQSREQFMVSVDAPVMYEFCAYDHG